MPYVIQGGIPTKVTVTREITVSDDGVLTCPECGREYKTETGLENHLADKH